MSRFFAPGRARTQVIHGTSIGVPLLLLLLTLLPSSRAQAEEPPADRLFREGREAMKRKDYQAACSKFTESQRLDPALGTQLNLAECEHLRGNHIEAHKHLKPVLEKLPPGDDRGPMAKSLATSIERKIGLLTVSLRSTAEVVRAQIDGADVPPSDLVGRIPLAPGEHRLTIHWKAKKPLFQRTFSVAAGKVEIIVAEPATDHAAGKAEESGAEPAAGHADKQKPQHAAPSSFQRHLGYGLGAAGLSLVAVGAFLGLQARSKLSDAKEKCFSKGPCDNAVDARNSLNASNDFGQAANISFGIGALALGTGLVLVLTAPSPRASALVLAPTVGRNESGLLLRGDW